MEHLHPKLLEILTKDEVQRIEYIRKEKWIGYTKAEEALQEMQALLEYPKSSRMPGLLLIGETNNGKTALLDRFFRLNPITMGVNEEGLILPVVKVQAPPFPDEQRLYNNILDALNVPYRSNDKVDNKLKQIRHIVAETNVKVLLIDEIHHILSGTVPKQRAFLNVLKYLSNDMCISLVCAGTKDAKAAIGIEPQLSNRLELIDLPRWRMDKDFKTLLASFEKIIPLKNPSNLHTPELANKILSLSDGKLGEISNIIKRSAIIAIRDGSERITISTIDKIRFIAPELRRNTA
jgi:hypothetical protein